MHEFGVKCKSVSEGATEENLREHFGRFGTILDVKFINKTQPYGQRVANVFFDTAAAVDGAIRDSGGQHFIRGQFVSVAKYKAPREPIKEVPKVHSETTRKGSGTKQVAQKAPGNAPDQKNKRPRFIQPIITKGQLYHTDIHCAYCGYDDLKSLAYCPQENCKKWFCNGTQVFREGLTLEKSHIVLHACLSRHSGFRLMRPDTLVNQLMRCGECGVTHFRRIDMDFQPHTQISSDLLIDRFTWVPMCNKCKQRNIFEIGSETNEVPNEEQIWCRQDATKNDKIAKDEWNTVVASKKSQDHIWEREYFYVRIASNLLKPVKRAEMARVFGQSYLMWGFNHIGREGAMWLEDFWRWNPAGTREEFLLWKREMTKLRERKLYYFEEPEDYVDHWKELVEELALQEKRVISILPPLRSTDIKSVIWDRRGLFLTAVLPFTLHTPFLEMGRPVEVCSVAENDGKEYNLWSRDASISSVVHGVTDTTMKLRLLSRVTERDVQAANSLKLTLQYNDINFWRVGQAMYKIINDPNCMGFGVKLTLLGKELVDQELTAENMEPDSAEDSTSDDGMQMVIGVEDTDDAAAEDSSVADTSFEVNLEDMPQTINSTNKPSEPRPYYVEYQNHQLGNYRFTQIFCSQERVLNKMQKAAVRNALMYPVSCIQGPPGTGKTQTAASIIVNFLKDSGRKILCCAPSNTAVDHLMRKLLELKVGGRDIRILRHYAHTRDLGLMDKTVQQYTVQAYYKRERKGIPKDEYELRRYAADLIREGIDVVCTTCNSAGAETLRGVPFPYVLIDEAAQAMETDCLVPMTKACEKLVLIGDPAQLGPVIPFTHLQRSQLSESLIQRLWNKCPSVMLTTQYRMHPEICKMVSETTYEGKLENDASVVNRSPPSLLLEGIFHRFGRGASTGPHHVPMLFVDISRNDELAGIGTSFVNVGEAHIIARVVANILCDGDLLPAFQFDRPKPPNPGQIGIITFYNGQRSHLDTQLKHHIHIANRTQEIDINSVDGFQGREKDIIVLSCVKSGDTTLGFTDHEQRLNVAMSRARMCLIVVGDRQVFQNSLVWAKYLRYIKSVPYQRLCEQLQIKCNARRNNICKICPATGA